MIQGGGKLFIGSGGRLIGAGHFGLLDLGQGVQKFSMHWEADLDKGGASVLDIRPLLWKDAWPVAGENLKDGTYEIESLRTGTALELAVEGMPVGGPRKRGPRPPGATGPGGMFAGTGVAHPATRRRASLHQLARRQRRYAHGQLPLSGPAKVVSHRHHRHAGYPGSPYFKITIAGTDRALAATPDSELVVVPAFTGAPEQLWRIDQLPDATWRITPNPSPV